ncbi:MAG: threonine-phosphate decarboxylase [Clostridium butyricum]|nr:threonine-phosphate decarboxylase [Clostridium butyricum]
MANFGHGGNAQIISRKMNINFEDIIDFSANINPLGIPKSIKSAIIENLNLIEKYPDISYFDLKKSISKFENIKEEYILLGNGAAEVIFSVVRAINPKNSLIMAPTFSEYEEAVASVGGNIRYYYLKEENDFKIQDDILECINNELDLIFICNPNNPTGVLTSKELLLKILIKAKKNNVKVLIDESFLDFIKDGLTMICYLNAYDNLIIVKSLTKFFALPGLRIGYGLSSNGKLKERTEEISPAWNINILAEVATKSALLDEKYIKETIKFINAEKDYLYNELNKIKELKVFKSSANFIFIKVNKYLDLKEKLLNFNILIRSCSNYKGLNNKYYRLAVRTHEENKKLIENLHKVLK